MLFFLNLFGLRRTPIIRIAIRNVVVAIQITGRTIAVIRITAKARVDIVRSFNHYAVFQGPWSLCHGLSRI